MKIDLTKVIKKNLDDYVVIGAEIFKNAFKESVKISNSGGNTTEVISNLIKEVKKVDSKVSYSVVTLVLAVIMIDT